MNFEKLFVRTCKTLGKNPDRFNVWLTFLGEDKMRELNARTRGIDKATDVLSYPVEDKIESDKTELGDIVICKRAAKQMKIPVGYLYVHGLLHLFGFDHLNAADEEKMTKLTEEICYGKGGR